MAAIKSLIDIQSSYPDIDADFDSDPSSMIGANTYSFQINNTMSSYPYTAKSYTVGVSNYTRLTAALAVGVREVTTVTCNGDSGGSKAGAYFTFQVVNPDNTLSNYYVWYLVSGAGTDPAVSGATGIMIILSTGAPGNTVANATRNGISAAIPTLVTISGGGSQCIITNKYYGAVTNAANGAVNPAFSYGYVQGVDSNYANRYFTFSTAHNAVGYYVWFNYNSTGVDPHVPGKTGILVAVASGASGSTIASSTRTNISMVAPISNVIVSGSGTVVDITNSFIGACATTVNGPYPTGFGITTLRVGTDGGVDQASSTFTITNHGFATGLRVQLTAAGILPSPIQKLTSYYVIVLTANTFRLASSLENAHAGTFITLLSSGTDGDVQTVTPELPVVYLEQSNNGEVWSIVGASTPLVQNGPTYISGAKPTAKYLRVSFDFNLANPSLLSINNLIKGEG